MSSATMRVALVFFLATLLHSMPAADETAKPETKPPAIDLPLHAADYPWAKDIAPATTSLLETYLKEQSLESFLKVRQAVADSPAYDPYSSDTNEVSALIEAGKFEDARTRLTAMAPNMFLDPRHHMLLHETLKGLKDEAGARNEMKFCILCIRGILATGDGSKDHAYLVLRVDDEYDVMAFLGLKDFKQSLVRDKERHFDRFVAKDGSEMWFDVTIPFNHLVKQLHPDK